MILINRLMAFLIYPMWLISWISAVLLCFFMLCLLWNFRVDSSDFITKTCSRRVSWILKSPRGSTRLCIYSFQFVENFENSSKKFQKSEKSGKSLSRQDPGVDFECDLLPKQAQQVQKRKNATAEVLIRFAPEQACYLSSKARMYSKIKAVSTAWKAPSTTFEASNWTEVSRVI